MFGDVKATAGYTEVDNSPRSILSTLKTSLIYLNIVIGDSIVLWKVCALWRDRQTVVYLPGALLVCTAVSWLSFTGYSIQSNWNSHSSKCDLVILLTYVLSLSGNTVTKHASKRFWTSFLMGEWSKVSIGTGNADIRDWLPN
ncbi:hypothetical protein Moror_17798 [Moniliophthora roreri MCA 2997]|uniref:Uncharacterized protein n=1 Tax=Moniliophthora roreri (strain MCA 2997) TaxID=1381753 RepID=V2XUB6_MONRO|nr:hypothetical protein Moror_17798 [Moniliophthora roreri MCA 2997]